jgi:hypothetical protein
MDLLITGGEQRGRRGLGAGSTRWYRYRRAHLVGVEFTDDGARTTTLLSYESPADVCADDDPAILFKQGHRTDGQLYLTTPTEVITLAYPSLERTGYVSLPSFHDVHHVQPTPEGTLLVVNTGLDQLVEVTTDGEIVSRQHVVGDDPWGGRFTAATDYRREATTKPYEAHPNHVFFIGEERWVTRFEKRDAVCIDDRRRRIDIGVERVHDGLVVGDEVYFTAVDGHVVIADTGTLEVIEVIDLNALSDDGLLGWCRGIHIVGDEAWIGFSRLRPTAIRENVAWVKEGFRKGVGTHIARYDLHGRRLLDRVPLEEVTPLNAVFSIMPA